mmetsp:Transcript_70071/g.196350  ORF Transcript_70071/g.196350 Transcript_70071/m.196350 type:complete len:208 (-) Transcript_70071:222-845(-)
MPGPQEAQDAHLVEHVGARQPPRLLTGLQGLQADGATHGRVPIELVDATERLQALRRARKRVIFPAIDAPLLRDEVEVAVVVRLLLLQLFLVHVPVCIIVLIARDIVLLVAQLGIPEVAAQRSRVRGRRQGHPAIVHVVDEVVELPVVPAQDLLLVEDGDAHLPSPHGRRGVEGLGGSLSQEVVQHVVQASQVPPLPDRAVLLRGPA